MAAMLPRKRSAPGQSGQSNANPPNGNATTTRYDRLLSILTKSLTQSREKIASDAPRAIKESYGDMTSLFTSSEDGDGVSTLVDLLLAKLDNVHDRFSSEKLSVSGSSLRPTRLEKILGERNVRRMLEKVETAIEDVMTEEQKCEDAEAADKTSAREAIKRAKSTRVSPTSGKKRRVLPAESIGYHAHRLKLEYQQSLANELGEIEEENKTLEEELKRNWGEWKTAVEMVKSALETMGELAGVGNENNGAAN